MIALPAPVVCRSRVIAGTNPKNLGLSLGQYFEESGSQAAPGAGDSKMSDKSELTGSAPAAVALVIRRRLPDGARAFQPARVADARRVRTGRAHGRTAARRAPRRVAHPIRLALERLAHMGLLDVNATGGFTVRGYTPAEALDAIEIRGVARRHRGAARRGTARRRRGTRHAAPPRRADGSSRASDARLVRATTWISTKRFTPRSSIWRRARC